jgi:hypothetical protein
VRAIYAIAVAAVGGTLAAAGSAAAGEKEVYRQREGEHPPRFAERAPPPFTPAVRTPALLGYPQSVRPHAVPAVTKYETVGYVGGARLWGNNVTSHAPPTGNTTDGTFGKDFVGFGWRPGRIFLGAGEPHKPSNFYRGYLTDVKFPTDVFALRPLRKAILEKKEALHPSPEE